MEGHALLLLLLLLLLLPLPHPLAAHLAQLRRKCRWGGQAAAPEAGTASLAQLQQWLLQPLLLLHWCQVHLGQRRRRKSCGAQGAAPEEERALLLLLLLLLHSQPLQRQTTLPGCQPGQSSAAERRPGLAALRKCAPGSQGRAERMGRRRGGRS